MKTSRSAVFVDLPRLVQVLPSKKVSSASLTIISHKRQISTVKLPSASADQRRVLPVGRAYHLAVTGALMPHQLR